jgi:hypothetical protein
MNKIDAMIAPRALTALELAQVLSPNLIVYGIAHRAFIHNGTLQDDTRLEVAVVSFSESALQAIAADGLRSVSEWLADMEGDKEPRFYRKASLKDAVTALCEAAASLFVRLENPADVATLADKITERDPAVLNQIIQLSE